MIRLLYRNMMYEIGNKYLDPVNSYNKSLDPGEKNGTGRVTQIMKSTLLRLAHNLFMRIPKINLLSV